MITIASKERLLFLLRIKEGDEVLFTESDGADEVVVELKDVLNNRIWLSNTKSVRCHDGCYSYEDIVDRGRKYRRIEPIGETMKEIKFWFYYFTAKSRGWNRSCNIFHKGPSVRTGICKLGEIRTMYFRCGWIPYRIMRNSSSFITKD